MINQEEVSTPKKSSQIINYACRPINLSQNVNHYLHDNIDNNSVFFLRTCFKYYSHIANKHVKRFLVLLIVVISH